ncbi:MAG: sulfite exporter TauE/SafE family protein, partial [Gammaproteobacteria bacterium]|nr:sulfite exporter TauE/SafE family protein [Gammaproteobacteria bacterium]
PYIPVGLVHGFLTTAIGGSAILQMIIMRTNLIKRQVTGTLASCFLAMEAMRVMGYASVGFNYVEHITVIIFASITGILGTWVGKHTEHFISEKNFRIVFKWMMTLIALRLIYNGSTML